MSTTRPGKSRPRGTGLPRRYDPSERLTGARLTHRNPHWLVTWGTHSRMYWAFPLFSAPPGTIITAPDPAALAAQMRQAEADLAARPGVRPG